MTQVRATYGTHSSDTGMPDVVLAVCRALVAPPLRRSMLFIALASQLATDVMLVSPLVTFMTRENLTL